MLTAIKPGVAHDPDKIMPQVINDGIQCLQDCDVKRNGEGLVAAVDIESFWICVTNTFDHIWVCDRLSGKGLLSEHIIAG